MGSGRGCCGCGVGRLLELKLGAVVREPSCILTSSECSGELLPVGVGFGECLFLIVPVPLPQLLCFLVWHWDAAIFPTKPCPSCAASAASDNLQYARYLREKKQKQILGTLFH